MEETEANAEAPQTIAEVAVPAAIEKPPEPLPSWMTISIVAVVTSVIVWGILEVVKAFFKDWKKKHNGNTPWYWNGGLRLSALVIGAAVGTSLYAVLDGTSAGYPWGTAIGCGAGAMSSLIVAVVRKRIRALGDAKSVPGSKP